MGGLNVAFRGGEYFFPFTSIVHDSGSVSSNRSGWTRIILPSFTWTKTGPPTVQLVKICSGIAPLLSSRKMLTTFQPLHDLLTAVTLQPRRRPQGLQILDQLLY